MRWFKKRQVPQGRPITRLSVDDSRNTLTVEADPVVLDLPMLGIVLILVPAPAPDFIHDHYFMSNETAF